MQIICILQTTITCTYDISIHNIVLTINKVFDSKIHNLEDLYGNKLIHVHVHVYP
jgi:hypothetical protein